MLAALLALALAAGSDDRAIQSEERNVGAYTIRIDRSLRTWERSLTVSRGGKQVYARTGKGGGSFFFASGMIDDGTLAGRNFFVAGVDERARAQGPPFVVGEWTGGASCCAWFHGMLLGSRFWYAGATESPLDIGSLRWIPKDEEDDGGAGDGAEHERSGADESKLTDLDGDGVPEVRSRDFAYAFGIPAFWPRLVYESPAPRIVLRRSGAGWEIAPDLMRKPPPSDEALSATAKKVRGIDRTALAEAFLDLAYTGHLDAATRLLALAWAGTPESLKALEDEFRGKLAESPYCRRLFPEPICARAAAAPPIPLRGERSKEILRKK